MTGQKQRALITAEPRRFYDGGDSTRAPDPGAEPVIVLRRRVENGVELFGLPQRLGYRDRHLGELLVPGDIEGFRTDLTSVPSLLTWLVPRTGRHLPAVLIHDGLVGSSGYDPSYLSTEGHLVDRVDADRVLRDAMADTRTHLLRRWLIWAGVTVATLVRGGSSGWSATRRWRYRLTVLATVAVIGYLGTSATADLIDVAIPGLVGLPWMGERSLLVEVAGGLAGAVVVPLLLAGLWGRFARAGAIVGVGIAVLLHLTVVVLVFTAIYQALEHAVRLAPRLVGLLAGLVVLVAVATLAVLV